jgi:excisionase family DNA binding protein
MSYRVAAIEVQMITNGEVITNGEGGLGFAKAKGGLARIKHAQDFLQVSRSKVYLLMKSGELPSVKLGKNRRIPWAALYALLDRSRAD